jgi:mannose-6-phosphate isomerase-like protein (cupin superfamily)
LKKHNNISYKTIGDWLSDSDSKAVPNDQIVEAESAIMDFAKAYSVAPPSHLRGLILSRIKALNAQDKRRTKLQFDNLPMLAENSNWLDWQAVIEGIEPPAEFENIHLHPIEANEKRELFVAWVKKMVDEEVHTDLLESFLILEGSCECHICNEKGETRIVRLGQGDYITMQLGETHDIVITSLQPAKAILEWRKLAA